MTLFERINDIRWKYFTNKKAGLIFKELMKEFRMVEQMTENKQYAIVNTGLNGRYIKENGKMMELERVVDLLNENEQLKEEIKELELENMKHIGDGEWDIRDITYAHGKFKLEEWGQRYHQFYNGDNPIEDEEVVSLLFENEQLKKEKELLEAQLYCTDESGVCGICYNEYLEPDKSPHGYYISKCKKGHDKCSKRTLKYCSDFKLKNKRLNGGV